MAIEKVKLKHECIPKHLLMETATMKQDKETEVEDKQRKVKMRRSKLAQTNNYSSGPPTPGGRYFSKQWMN